MSSKAQNRMDQRFSMMLTKAKEFQCRFKIHYCQVKI